MADAGYRIVASTHYTPAALALAPRHARFEDAVRGMGEGIVLAEGGRIAAFHEKHLRFVEHALVAS